MPYFRFHIEVISYGICLSLSDLLHLVCSSLGSSMLLPMEFFHSFLWPSSIPSPLHIYHIIFIHSSVGGQLGCFHVFTGLNTAAISIWVHASFQRIFLFRYIPRSEMDSTC